MAKVPTGIPFLSAIYGANFQSRPVALHNEHQTILTTEDTEFHGGNATEVNRVENVSVVFPIWAESAQECSSDLAPVTQRMFMSGMDRCWKVSLWILLLHFAAIAATKPHVVTIGHWTTISLRNEDAESPPASVKIRPLYVDGRTKEFTIGMAHDVTERIFVVQRIYRMNDSLPQQVGPTQWQWQRGGWLLIDRVSGKVQQLALSEFDPDASAANWFRDYAAYCGISDDGQKLFAVIVQIGRRKPLLKKPIGNVNDSHPTCAPPVWERDPVRVIFAHLPDQKLTFAVKSRAVDAITQDESEGGE